MYRPSSFSLSIVGTFSLLAILVIRGSWAADLNLTIDNAPPVAKQMGMTVDEFRSILPDRLKPYVAFAPARASMTERDLGRQDGQLFIWGKWGRKGNYYTGPLDLQYRVATKGPYNNPAFCYVVTALLTVPPAKDQPEGTLHWTEPARRIDIEIRGSVNSQQADPEYIQKYMAQLAKSAAEGKGTSVYLKPRHIPDLGFGLDRNDMFVALEPKPVNNGSCEVNVYLADSRKALYVEVRVKCGYRAVSPKQTIALAKNAAAIMANKVFGTNAKLDRDKGEVGILDAYLASRLGETPQEDVRENKFKLGDTIYLAVVYRATQPGMRVRVSGHMRPGPDALVASEARAPLIRPGVMSKWHSPTPLQPDKLYHRFSTWINSSGQVDEDNSDHTEFLDATVSVKPLTADTQVFYIALTTGQTDNLEKFFLGIGRWDIALSMSEYRGKEAAFETRYSKESLEVSTEKISLIMDDNPVVARRYLTDLPKKP